MLSKLVLHFCLLAFVFVIWLATDPSTTLFVGGIAATLVYGILITWECWNSKEVISPFSYHFLWNFAALGIAAVYFAFATWHGEWAHFDIVNYVSPKSLAAGYVLCLSGSFLLHATMRFAAPQIKPPSEPKRVIHPFFGLFLFVIGCIAIMAPRGIPLFEGLIASLVKLSPLAILMAIAFGPKARRFYWSKLVIGTSILVAANMLALFPYKSGVLQSVFPLTIALWKKSRALTITCLCAIPLLYLGIVAPYVTASRSKNADTTTESLSDASIATAFSTPEIDPQTRDETPSATLMSRIFEPIEAGYIVHDTHLHGFLWGETFKNVEYALIPRFVWPDKPEMNAGKWFTEYLGYSVNSSTTMSGAGELYWNFSILGLVFGTAIIGLLYCLLWRIAEHLGKDTYLGSLLYVLVLVATFSSGTGSDALIMVPSILVLLFPILVMWPRAKKLAAWYFRLPASQKSTAISQSKPMPSQ